MRAAVAPVEIQRLQSIRTFDQLIGYLRDVLDWPVSEDTGFDNLTFDYDPEEVGLDAATAVRIERIRQLRPLENNQPWGIFFIEFKPGKLPITVLRRILRALVVKKRASDDRQRWEMGDLLFISTLGEADDRSINLAHFTDEDDARPTLRVVDWNEDDAHFHMLRTLDELNCLRWPDDTSDVAAWRETWSEAFRLKVGQVAKTAKQLATQMASLAKLIRARVNAAMAVESESGPLKRMYSAFKDALVSDLTPDGFADMYAQTITYGLFAAARSRLANISTDTVRQLIPNTNPFLRDLLAEFTDVSGATKSLDFDELGINALVEVLNQADLDAVVADFDDKNPDEDPVIHFYEDFLHQYDSKMKVQRGVFFTPRPVVSFIVRSVDQLLRTDFGLEDGLADTTTWGEMIERHPDLMLPDGATAETPFVQILDPAVGTGTFLVEAIDVIERTVKEKWKKQGLKPMDVHPLWNDYVTLHLLPRLYGFELMMASYAIAHMKVGLRLAATGYNFASTERLRIYLTNTLEEPHDVGTQLQGMAPALAHEATACKEVKRRTPFTVVIGNPPYSIRSANLSNHARGLVDVFRQIDGVKVKEKGALQLEKNLNDDYIKFLAYADKLASDTGSSILSYVTNHAYLDNPTLRGVRARLAATFSDIRIVDLHGSSKRKEVPPDNASNENVFDIQQGVSVSTLVRWSASQGWHHEDVWGDRARKYRWLIEHTAAELSSEFVPVAPLYLFVREDMTLRDEYESYLSLVEMFPVNSTGIKTHRDAFAIDFDRRVLLDRVEEFRDGPSAEEMGERFNLRDTFGWNLARSWRQLRTVTELGSSVQPILYRPFDQRFVFYSPLVVELPRERCMTNLLDGRNLALLSTRQVTALPFRHAFATRFISEMKTASHDRATNCFPLFLVHHEQSLDASAARTPNLTSTLYEAVAARLGSAVKVDDTGAAKDAQLTPWDLFYWTYAILHAPSYCSRYGQFLMRDFPRVPLTSNRAQFDKLSQHGADLVGLHLLEDAYPPTSWNIVSGSSPFLELPAFDGDVRLVAKGYPKYANERVSVNPRGRFVDVAADCWAFQIGGYQVCEKWLKDRRGRTLSDEDITHYGKIVVAIRETIRIMGEIDAVIDEHGGWPLPGSVPAEAAMKYARAVVVT